MDRLKRLGIRLMLRKWLQYIVIGAISIAVAQQVVTKLAAHQTSVSLESHQLDRADWWIGIWGNCSSKSSDCLLAKARLSRLRGRTEEMQAALVQAQKCGASRESVKIEETLGLAQAGQLSQVEDRLKSLLVEQRVNLSSVCEAYINGFLLNYRFGDAAALLEVWEKDFPDAAQPKFVRGMIDDQLGNSAAAISSYQAAFTLDRGRSDIRLRLAIALTRQHDFQSAVEHFRALTPVYAEYEDFLLNYATCLTEMGDRHSAQPVLSQLLRQNPQHRDANLLLARHYFATHEYQAASQVVQNRLRNNLRDYDFRYLFALILRAQGKTEEAATHMGFVEASDAAMARIRIAMDQTRDEPQRADTRFEIGIELMELGFRVEAANWLRSVLEVEPNHLAAHDALAKFYHDEGQPALALRHEVARRRLKIK